MKSTILTLAAVLGIALASASIPVANANADALYGTQGHSNLAPNANQ
jgi:hypothetical protein